MNEQVELLEGVWYGACPHRSSGWRWKGRKAILCKVVIAEELTGRDGQTSELREFGEVPTVPIWGYGAQIEACQRAECAGDVLHAFAVVHEHVFGKRL